MVEGIDSFRDKFRDYTDCYTVIGGAACDILMSEAEIAFRATKDIDMILILEDKKAEFAEAFWEYIRDGGYRCGWKNNADVYFLAGIKIVFCQIQSCGRLDSCWYR